MDTGIKRVGNYVYNEPVRRWVKEPLDRNEIVQISGITPTASGRLPVDTELTIAGDVIIEDIQVQSAPLTEVHISGVTITAEGKVPVDTEITIGGVAIVSQPPVIISGTQNALPITDNSGSITVDGNVTVNTQETVNIGHPVVISGTQTVDAIDLDIRDLASSQDSVAIPNGVAIISQPPVIASGTQSEVILDADDLVTVINYNDAARTSVSGVEYSSVVLGYTSYETFVSGTNVIVITRTVV